MIKLSNINPFMEKLSDYNANRAYEVATLGSLGGIIGGVGLGHLLDKRKAKADLRKFEDAGYPELKANYTTPKRYKVLGGLAGSRLGGALALALYNGMPSKQASIKLADVPFYAKKFNMGLLSEIATKALSGAGLGFMAGHRQHRHEQGFGTEEDAKPKGFVVPTLIGALSGASVGNSLSGILHDDPVTHQEQKRRDKAQADAEWEEHKKKHDAEYDAKWNAYEQKYEKEREDQQAREKQYQSDYQSKQKSDDDAYKKEYARRRYGEGYDHEGFRVMPDEFMNLYNPQQHGDAKYVSKIWESLRRSGLVNLPERVKAVESFMKAYGTPNADPNVLKGYVDALGGGTSNEGTLLRMLWEKKYGNPGSSQQKLSFYKAAELFGSLLANEEASIKLSSSGKGVLALPIVGALYGGGYRSVCWISKSKTS